MYPIRSSFTRFLLLALSLCAATLPARAASCSPPPSIAPRLTGNPGAEIYAQLGQWFAARNQPACAADAYQKALALRPDSAPYAWLLGLSLFTASRTRQSIAPLQQSLRLDPRSLNAHLLLASALERTGDRPAAELQWRIALALDPHAPLAIENLSRDLLADGNYSSIIEWLGPVAASAQLTAPAAINLSVAYTKSGLLDDASSLLQATLHANPGSVPVVEALAAVLVLQNREDPAVALLAAAVREHPADTQLQILWLRALVLAHDPSAGPLARRLLAENPHQWELLYLTGLLRRQAGDFPAARIDFQQSLARNPGYADAHFQLGLVLESLGSKAAARQQFQQAIALGFNSPEVYFDLGRVLHALGDQTGAQQEMQRYHQAEIAQLNEPRAATASHQGDLASAAGNDRQAAADYRLALTLDPNESLLAYKLAMALERSGDRAGERTALEQAVRINPRMAEAQNQLGYLDSVEDNAGSAIHRFQLAVQADPGYTKAWMNLAAELCLQSRWQDARAALVHVLQLDPASAPALALQQRLDQIAPQP